MQVFYRDSTGMEVVVKDGSVHVVSPTPLHIFNHAHLASLISGLVMAHEQIAPRQESETNHEH